MNNDRLRLTRIERGFTQQHIADYLDTGLRNYQKYESGDATPSVSRLVKLADILGVPTDYLLGRDNVMIALGVSVDLFLKYPLERPIS